MPGAMGDQEMNDEDILRNKVKQLATLIGVGDNTPHIQASNQALDYQMLSASNKVQFQDHHLYTDLVFRDMELAYDIEAIMEEGHQHIDTFYTSRSIADALDKSEGLDKAARRGMTKDEIENDDVKKTIDVMRPFVAHMGNAVAFIKRSVVRIRTITEEISSEFAESPDAFTFYSCADGLLRAVDVIAKLDIVKNSRTCLEDDYETFSDALEIAKSGSSNRYAVLSGNHEEIRGYLFPDKDAESSDEEEGEEPHVKDDHTIFSRFRTQIKQVSGHEDIFIKLANYAMDRYQNSAIIAPEEKFMLVRVLPYIMLLVDGTTAGMSEEEDKKRLNIFKSKKTKAEMTALMEIVKEMPYVPVYMDVTIQTAKTFEFTPHFSSKDKKAWLVVDDDAVYKNYDILDVAHNVNHDFNNCINDLTFIGLQLQAMPFHRCDNDPTAGQDHMARHVFTKMVDALGLMGMWMESLQKFICWKMEHPKEPNVDDSSESDEPDEEEPEGEYDEALRSNLSTTELTAITLVLTKIKAMQAIVVQMASTVVPAINYHVHNSVQHFLQSDIVPTMARAERKHPKLLQYLLDLRNSACDWKGGITMHDDYKNYRRGTEVHSTYENRLVAPSTTQVALLRAQIKNLVGGDCPDPTRPKTTLKQSMLPDEVKELEDFLELTRLFEPMLHLQSTLKSVSDVSFLWFRENFLQLLEEPQVSLEQSVPWFLAEHVFSNDGSMGDDGNGLESLLAILEIYNDAARNSLFETSQQFLYNEIEAEANIFFDHMCHCIADEFYTSQKDAAALSLMDQKQVRILVQEREEKSEPPLTTSRGLRSTAIAAQHHVGLLGRSLDLCLCISVRCQALVVQDLDMVLTQYESGPCTGIIDTMFKLGVVGEVHGRLSTFLKMSPFDELFHTVNESVEPIDESALEDKTARFCGRVTHHTMDSLVEDLVSNFNFNRYTMRFVPSPLPLNPVQYSKAPRDVPEHFGFGKVCSQHMKAAARLQRDVFGQPHVDAMLNVLGLNTAPAIVQELLALASDKIHAIHTIVDSLLDETPVVHVADRAYNGLADFYTRLVEVTAGLREYEDLKRSVFQTFRELGNIMALLQMISGAVARVSKIKQMHSAPFTSHEHDDDDAAASSDRLKIMTRVYRVMQTLSEDEGLARLASSLDVVNTFPDVQQLLNSTTNANFDGNGSIYTFCLHKLAIVAKSSAQYKEVRLLDGKGRLMVDRAGSFSNIWCYLNAIFCFPDDLEVDENESSIADRISNEEEFGHGFALGGAVMLHLLGERALYEIYDWSNIALRIANSVSPRGEIQWTKKRGEEKRKKKKKKKREKKAMKKKGKVKEKEKEDTPESDEDEEKDGDEDNLVAEEELESEKKEETAKRYLHLASRQRSLQENFLHVLSQGSGALSVESEINKDIVFRPPRESKF